MTEKHRSTPTPPTGNRSDPGVTLTVTSWRADMRREWGQGMHKRPPPGSWFTPSTDEEILASIIPPATTTLTTTTTTTTTILTNHQNNITNNDTITHMNTCATTTISTLLNNHSAAILDSPATTFEKILASFASNNDDSSQQQQQQQQQKDQVSTSIATMEEQSSVVEQEHLKRQVPLPLPLETHANASNTLENIESNVSENENVLDNDDMEGRRIMIEELREQASNRGKKKRNSAWAVFTRYIDTRSAANVSNQSPLRPSRIVKKRHDQVLYVPYYSLRKKNCQMKMTDESGENDSLLTMKVRVHMIDGTVFTAQFCSSDTVRQVCEYVMQMAHGNHVSVHEHEDDIPCETNDNYCNFNDENNDDNDDDDIHHRLGYHHWWRVNVVGTAPNSYTNGIRICSRYPRRKFSQCDDWDITLKDAGLYPSASVFVEKDDQGFVLNYAPKYGYKSLFAPTK